MKTRVSLKYFVNHCSYYRKTYRPMENSVSYRKTIFHIIDENKGLVWKIKGIFFSIGESFPFSNDQKVKNNWWKCFLVLTIQNLCVCLHGHITEPLKFLKLCEIQKKMALYLFSIAKAELKPSQRSMMELSLRK